MKLLNELEPHEKEAVLKVMNKNNYEFTQKRFDDTYCFKQWNNARGGVVYHKYIMGKCSECGKPHFKRKSNTKVIAHLKCNNLRTQGGRIASYKGTN